MSKKKKRKLLVMLAAVICLALAYAAEVRYLARRQEKLARSEEKKAEDLLRLSIPEEEIRSIRFSGEKGEITFVQDQGKWTAPDDVFFEMDPDSIGRLLGDLRELKAQRVLPAEKDLSKFGLDPPAQTVEITLKTRQAGSGKAKETVQLYIGARNDSSHELYAATSLAPEEIFLTKTALDEHFSGSLERFALYEEAPVFREENIRGIAVEKKEDSFTLVTPGDNTCTVTDAAGETQSADVTKAGAVLQNLSHLMWLANLAYHVKDPQDLKSYGLDEPQAVIRVKQVRSQDKGAEPTDAQPADTGAEDAKTDVLLIGSEDENGNYYVQLENSSQVHSIRGEYLRALAEGTARDFWNLSYSFVSVSDLDHLEVTKDGKTLSLQRIARDGKQDDEHVVWMADEREVTKEVFTRFYYACASMTIQERISPVPEYREEPALSLTYYLKDGSEKQMCYYPEDQNFYIVVYEEGTKAGRVNRLHVQEMFDSLEALIDG